MFLISRNVGKQIAIVVATFAISCTVASPQRSKTAQIPQSNHQSEFGAEGENWIHPIPVPKSVLQDLRNATGANEDEMPEDSLLTSEVDLGGTDEEGLIVMGIDRLRLPPRGVILGFQEGSHGLYDGFEYRR